jgi:hypothetical protein
MTRIVSLAIAAALVGLSARAEETYSIKLDKAPPPKELKESFRNLLSDQAVVVLNEKGAKVGEIWLRKDVPAKATPEQIKNGLTYRELEETTFLGVLELAPGYTDFRKQKIRPGVYTLRLAFQPMDGDHMGTAPYPEFCALVPAAREESPEPLKDAKALHERSTRASGTSHPAVLLLFPNSKPADTPKLENKGNETWVLDAKETAMVNGQKVPLGIGLAVIGHAAE